MIKSAADRRTARFLTGAPVKEFRSFLDSASRRLRVLNDAISLGDLASLSSNGFQALKGDRKGQHSIRINAQWRICFRFSKGDAYDVEIVDYH